MFKVLKQHKFLFEELVKRDFKKKYKGTVLGIGWSLLAPLLQLLIITLVFTTFFGRNTPHYTIFVFSGTIVFSFFTDATKGGMGTIVGNSGIFTKVNVPKYLFLFSKNVQSFINFMLILVVFFHLLLENDFPLVSYSVPCSVQSRHGNDTFGVVCVF